jgi:SAM-dependent methyltransferase
MEIKPQICPICNGDAPFRLNIQNTDYWQCESCDLLFSYPIDQDNLVGGQHEDGRALQNHIRLDRIKTMLNGMNKEDIHILDYGCGHGRLVEYLRNEGYDVTGFDPFNPEYSRLPEKNKYHLCVCVEVIEHTSAPFIELDVINRSLVDGALLYVETGFIDIAIEDKIPLELYLYVNPSAGHATIFSHHAMDYLMLLKGFRSKRHFDRNCRLYTKIK